MNGQLFTFDATVSVSLLFSVMTAVFSWWRTREDRAAKQITDLRAATELSAKESAKKVMQLELEMQQLQHRLDNVPSAETMHRLELMLTETNGRLGMIDERLRPVSAITERMQELMLEQARSGR